MSVQQLNQCTFNVGGSYTNNNVVNLKVVTKLYHERASRTSCKTVKLTPSESIANLLLEAERLQQTAKDLSHQLKLTTTSQLEYNDLATTLSEIADETIPCIFRISLDNHQRDVHCQYRVLIEIAYMQGILDEFVKKRTTEHNNTMQGLTRITTVNAIIHLLRSYFEWLFDSQYPVVKIRESLCLSRDRIHLALFKPMISSLGKRIRGYQIDIDDFFGAQWSLPQDLCLNRQVFFSILRFKFQGGPAEMVVASEQFGIFRQDGLKAIQASDWEGVIKEGDGLQLSVLVARQSEDVADNPNALECPQCRQSDKTIPGGSLDGWANCLRCNSNFNITPMDSEDDSRQDSGSGTPSSHESLSLSSIEILRHSMTFRCFSVTISRKKPHRAASLQPLNNCIPNTQKRHREDEPSPPKRTKLDQDVALVLQQGQRQPQGSQMKMQARLEQQRQQQMGTNSAGPQVAQQLQPGAGQQPRRLTPQEINQRAGAIRMSINSMEDAYQKISAKMAPGHEKDVRLQFLGRDITARKDPLAKMQQALTQIAQNGGQLPPAGAGPSPWNIGGFENPGNTQPPRPMSTTGPSPNVQPSPSHVHSTPLQQPNLLPGQPGVVPPPRSGPTPSQQVPHPPNGTPGGPGPSNNPVAGTPNPFGQMSPSMGQMFSFNNSAPNAAIPSAAAPGVQQMPSGGPPGASAWPPALDKQKFDLTYKTYSTRTGIKHEMRLMNMDGKPIDLYALHVNVMQEGGWTKIHNKELWSVIGGRMGFVMFPGSDTEPAKSGPGVAQCLAQVYKEYLSGFDQVYINSMIDSRRKMQANQAGSGVTMPNLPINNGIQAQPGAQGVHGAAGAGAGLKPPPNNPVRLPKLMHFASLLPDQLRNQGLPEHMIPLIEQNRTMPGMHPGGLPGGQQHIPSQQTTFAQPPGITGPPNPEQIQVAQSFIARIQHEFRQRNLPTFRPFELPSEGQVEYQSMFQQLLVQVDKLDHRMPYLYFALRSEDSMRKVIAMVMTAKYQQQLLTSGNPPRVIITHELLRTMLAQVQAADNALTQFFVNKAQRPPGQMPAAMPDISRQHPPMPPNQAQSIPPNALPNNRMPMNLRAPHQASDWKWDGLMSTQDQPWAIS